MVRCCGWSFCLSFKTGDREIEGERRGLKSTWRLTPGPNTLQNAQRYLSSSIILITRSSSSSSSSFHYDDFFVLAAGSFVVGSELACNPRILPDWNCCASRAMWPHGIVCRGDQPAWTPEHQRPGQPAESYQSSDLVSAVTMKRKISVCVCCVCVCVCVCVCGWVSVDVCVSRVCCQVSIDA